MGWGGGLTVLNKKISKFLKVVNLVPIMTRKIPNIMLKTVVGPIFVDVKFFVMPV